MTTTTLNTINLVDFALRTSEGLIDISATLSKIESLYLDLACSEEGTFAKIGEAVHTVFSKYEGKAITMADLPGLTLMNVSGVTPDNISELTEAVCVYIRNSPDFYSNKGKGGGIRRISDMNEDTRKKMEENIAAKALKAGNK